MPLRIALVTVAALAASPAAGTTGPTSQPSASAQQDLLRQEVVQVKQIVDETHENGAPVKDEHGCPNPDRCRIPNVEHSCPNHPGPESEHSCPRES